MNFIGGLIVGALLVAAIILVLIALAQERMCNEEERDGTWEDED